MKFHMLYSIVGFLLLWSTNQSNLLHGAPPVVKKEKVKIPVHIHILKDAGLTKAQAKEAVKEASKILRKQKDLQIALDIADARVKRKDDGDDVHDGDAGNDGIIIWGDPGEDDAIRVGAAKFLGREKGFMVTFAKTPEKGTALPGYSDHKWRSAVVRKFLDGDGAFSAARTGRVIAHEIAHTFTLSPEKKLVTLPPIVLPNKLQKTVPVRAIVEVVYRIDDVPDITSDMEGHAPDIAGKNGRDNLMFPDADTGTHLTEFQLKKIEDDKLHTKWGDVVKKFSPPEKVHQQHGNTWDPLGDVSGGAAGFFDLSQLYFEAVEGEDELRGFVQLGGLFPMTGPFDANYLFQFPQQREIGIRVRENPSDPNEILIEGQLTNSQDPNNVVITPLLDVNLGTSGYRVNDTSTVAESSDFLFEVSKSELGLSGSTSVVPITVTAGDPNQTLDDTSLNLDLGYWLTTPTLNVMEESVLIGDTVNFEIMGLEDGANFSVFLNEMDDAPLLSGIYSESGGKLVGSFNMPVLPFDTHFLTAQDETGNFAFNVLTLVPEPSTFILAALGLLGGLCLYSGRSLSVR